MIIGKMINGVIIENQIKEENNMTVDNVNSPKHYNAGTIEVIEAIEDWSLGFNLGNAVKYIARADHKGKREEDLKKAQYYINRELESLEELVVDAEEEEDEYGNWLNTNDVIEQFEKDLQFELGTRALIETEKEADKELVEELTTLVNSLIKGGIR